MTEILFDTKKLPIPEVLVDSDVIFTGTGNQAQFLAHLNLPPLFLLKEVFDPETGLWFALFKSSEVVGSDHAWMLERMREHDIGVDKHWGGVNLQRVGPTFRYATATSVQELFKPVFDDTRLVRFLTMNGYAPTDDPRKWRIE